jgi:hypothetical protein
LECVKSQAVLGFQHGGEQLVLAPEATVEGPLGYFCRRCNFVDIDAGEPLPPKEY